jgi:hypothetical protein
MFNYYFKKVAAGLIVMVLLLLQTGYAAPYIYPQGQVIPGTS